MRRIAIFHPLLLAVFPVLALEADNHGSAPIGQVLRTAALCLAGAAILWCALRPTLRDWPRAAAMTSLVLVVFFSYGRLHALNDDYPIFRSRVLMPVTALVLAAAFWALRRARRPPGALSDALFAMSTFLVLVSASRTVSYRLRSRADLPSNGSRDTATSAGSRLLPAGELPDVYYIILDGYASFRTLRDVYGFDNRELLAALRDRGFYVAEDSHSNYAQTPLSLASSTNMEYIPGELEQRGRKNDEIWPLFKMIEESRVMRDFKSRGYRFVNFQSGWAVTAKNRNADWDVDCGGWGEFTRTLAETTLLEAFDLFQPIEKQSRDRILCEFSTLSTIPDRIAGPRYVFAHFVSPEVPLIFDRDGGPVLHHVAGDQWSDKPGYVEQAVFIGRKAIAAIDRILARSRVRPIIVVQADHGSASEGYRWMYANQGPPTTGSEPGLDVFLRERMGILNAYLLPNGGKGLYPSITPVNSFRVILNEYFGERNRLLEDRNFFSRYAHPYHFIDVTSRVAGRGGVGF